MTTTSQTRRAVTGMGATALFGMLLVGAGAAPALADGPTHRHARVAVAPQGPPSYNTWGEDVLPVQAPPSYNSWPGYDQPAPAKATVSGGLDIDYAQVGAGALGGALLTSVVALGLAATSRGRRAAVHA